MVYTIRFSRYYISAKTRNFRDSLYIISPQLCLVKGFFGFFYIKNSVKTASTISCGNRFDKPQSNSGNKPEKEIIVKQI